MADLQSLDLALEEALSSLSGLGLSLELRSEQKQAVMTLLPSRDLLAILPTGFGKSLIFQLLIRVKEILSSKPACVIVVCPLKSIVQDQLSEASSMGLSATSLSDASLEDVQNGKYRNSSLPLQRKFWKSRFSIGSKRAAHLCTRTLLP